MRTLTQYIHEYMEGRERNVFDNRIRVISERIAIEKLVKSFDKQKPSRTEYADHKKRFK